jgi:hypothetical protein
MTGEEAGKLLGMCASYDNRMTDDASTYAWYRALSDLPYEACENAVVAHYSESRDWIMPADVRTRVRRELNRQTDREQLREILDVDAYRKRIARTDAQLLRKIQERAGRTLRLKGIDD